LTVEVHDYWDICDSGCCQVIIDDEIRPADNTSVYEPRPMYQVLPIHTDGDCLSCWSCEHAAGVGPVMTVHQEDYNQPDVIFL